VALHSCSFIVFSAATARNVRLPSPSIADRNHYLSATQNASTRCQMSGSVTAQSLLRGAVYSLEHCGQLLGDAKTLYEHGSYATALAVGAFAREDLGRWRMLP
jgi:hypothetical protein